MEENNKRKSYSKEIKLGSILGFSSIVSEKNRDEFRKKNRIKLIDKKWLDNVVSIGSSH